MHVASFSCHWHLLPPLTLQNSCLEFKIARESVFHSGIYRVTISTLPFDALLVVECSQSRHFFVIFVPSLRELPPPNLIVAIFLCPFSYEKI